VTGPRRQQRGRRARRSAAGLAVLLLTSGCAAAVERAAPGCDDVERLALLAQSVPTATYVPCVGDLPAGWRVTDVDARRGGARLTLLSDRSGNRPVEVELSGGCDVVDAVPAPSRGPGARAWTRIESVSPVWSQTTWDVFPGGCVRTRASFPRGPHIPLLEELQSAVTLVPRREVRLRLREELGAELDP
jgi:hypothetical protein